MNKVEKIKAEIGIRIAEICDLTTGCIMDSKTAAEYRLLYELSSWRINPVFPPYEVFDKYKDDIEGLAAYMISEHPDMKEGIEKIVKQLKDK